MMKKRSENVKLSLNSKKFYDTHANFSLRSLLEYEISPGIKCKFDLILDNLDKNQRYNIGLDLGCSGNSFLYFLKTVKNNIYLDISEIPLSQYTSKEIRSIKCEEQPKDNNPICGDISLLPYANEKFDFVCSLDTLEHVKNDYLAISEISRILKENGICIITVPHRKDYYTEQDQIIGHYRRYEIGSLIKCFRKNHLICIRCFNVYGKLMKFAFLQTLDPMKTEKQLILLRQKYQSNPIFKYFWQVIVKFISKLMKLDAKYHKLRKGMNIGFIFIKGN